MSGLPILSIKALSDEEGAKSYNELTNLPKLNGTEIKGDKTSADYGIDSYIIHADDVIVVKDHTVPELTPEQVNLIYNQVMSANNDVWIANPDDTQRYKVTGVEEHGESIFVYVVFANELILEYELNVDTVTVDAISFGVSEIVDIGSNQYSYHDYVLPSISADLCRQIYTNDRNGIRQILRWTFMGSESNFRVVSSDHISTNYSFDLLVHNRYHCSYTWDNDTTSLVNPFVDSLDVDDVTINKNTNGELQVKDGAITSEKLNALLKALSVSGTPSDDKLITEKALYNYIASGNGGYPRALDNIDLNTVISTGFYSCNVCTNRPTENNGAMIVIRNTVNTNTLVQIYFSYAADEMWVRHRDNSIWKDWFKVVKSTDMASAISVISAVIPSDATTQNKLVSASQMGDAISLVEAKQLYATASQGSFATKAALTGATTYYNADGTVATPTKNDVAYVLADESHDGKSAKYVIAQVKDSTITWGFVITFSDTIFTQAQMNAINSGATQEKVSSYDTHIADNDIHVTATQKEAWNSKQNAISDLDNIRSGASAGATALQTNQGAANAGKVLKVGTDGTVAPGNEDVEVEPLTDGTMTLSTIKTMLDNINQEGRTVLFDTSSLPYDMIRCYISIIVENSQPKSYRVADQVSGKVSTGAYEADKTLANILSEAVEDIVTITVTCNTADGVTVTGQTVTLRNGSTEDAPIARQETYNGQPVTFVVPKDFAYFISASDTLSGHFNPNKVTGIAIHDTSVIITYKDVTSLQTAADIQAALDAGADLTAAVGSHITCAKNNTTLTWDIADYNGTTHEVTLLLHDTLPDQLVFEPAQALAYFPDGLAAGNYKFLHSDKTYYLTLTTAIPAGGQLRATTTALTTYESQDSSVSLESGVVSETEIAGATSLGATASGTLNHMDRVLYGSNNQKEAALQWWLNTDAAASTLVPRTNKFSRAYRYSVAGFLNGLDPAFLACIADTVWKCATNQTYEAPSSMGGTVEKSTPYTITAKFCLASRKEIFGDSGGTPDGSTQFGLFVGSTADDRKKYYNGSVRLWWLRSPYPYYASIERRVNTDGSVYYYDACYSIGVVPACKIRKSN